MSRTKNVFIAFFAGSMELCWLYSLVFFFFYQLTARQIPPMGGIFAFGLAATLRFFTRNKGWRVIYILGLHLTGFFLTMLAAVYMGDNWSVPWNNLGWLAEAGAKFGDFSAGAFLVAVASLVLFSWISGLCFAGRRPVYSTVTSRFDLGIIVFFFLFLIEGGLGEQVPAMSSCLFMFFLFGMLSIALVRSQGDGNKESPFYFGRLGFIFMLSSVVLLLAGGIVFFFLPGMSSLADTGYLCGKKIFAPLLNLFLKILSFLFCRRALRQEPVGPGASGGGLSIPETIMGAGSPLWEKIFTLGVFVLVGIAIIVIAGWGFYRFYSWLFSHTAGRKKTGSAWDALFMRLIIIGQKCRFFLLYCLRVFSKPVQRKDGARIYQKLLSWGRNGGFPRRFAETPGEYGARLGRHFPPLRGEISLIIDGYHDETYGEQELDKASGKKIQRAWRRLASPFCWVLRLKTRFLTVIRGG
ncbi:MAG TPA: DUF4129 domain-containing protein [Firmicutes bacterium]|jgi:hypothetical protein|nr:DUF4129 domain-containing protein [Bacillota bacterium]